MTAPSRTPEQMAHEVLEAWTANDPATVGRWPRGELWENALAVAEMAKAEAAASGLSDPDALAVMLKLHPSPGEPETLRPDDTDDADDM